MAAGKRRAKYLRILVSIVAVVVILFGSGSIWFPWVLPSIAKRFGANYAGYHRKGFQRFELSGFSLTNQSTVIHAERVEALVPTIWLWRHWTGARSDVFLQVDSWRYASVGKSSSTNSPYETFQQLEQTLTQLASWLPRAELTNGNVGVQEQSIRIPQAHWGNSRLSATIVTPWRTEPIALVAEVPRGAPMKLNLVVEELELRSSVVLTRSVDRLELEATTFWLSNQIVAQATLLRSGGLPQTASLRADSFSIPADLLKLPNYQSVAGSLQADWNADRFTVNLTAKALADQSTNLPPIDVEAHAFGDTNSAQIDVAKISAPGFLVELVAPRRILFHPPFLVEPTVLNVTADLEQQPWFAAQGRLVGQVTLASNEFRFPRTSFTFSGSNVGTSNIVSKSFEVAGEFLWPELKVQRMSVELTDGSAASVTGSWNIDSKRVEGGELNMSGRFGREFLPRGYSFESNSLHAVFSGPVAELSHTGSVQVTHLQLPKTKSMQLNASWTGRGWKSVEGDLALIASNASFRVRGGVELGSETKRLAVSHLFLGTNENAVLHLEKPFQAMFHKGSGSESNHWTLQVQPLRWSGSDRGLEAEADIDWPRRGSFRMTAKELGTPLVNEFVEIPDLEATCHALTFEGGWTNGPIGFTLKSEAELTTRQAYTFLVQMDVNGGQDGILIPQLSIQSATQLVCRAEGSLPFVFQPGLTDEVLQVRADAPLQFHAFTETNSALWSELAGKVGIQLVDPRLHADVDGTWSKPQGHVTLAVRKIQLPKTKHLLPTLEDLNLEVTLDREQASSQFRALVEGQEVVATAEMPLGHGVWTAMLRQHHLPDWREASGRLQIADADIAAFVPFAPEILAPEGTAKVDLKWQRGGNLVGEVALSNASTRPVATFGPVRSIGMQILFSGSEVVVTNCVGEIGGQRVSLRGTAQLDERFWREKTLPPFQVQLDGTNVPLVRQASAVVRTDLHLTATNSDGTNLVISGHARLRDSFFLSSLKDLAPGKVTSPKRRPPYFSIETEPWARARLALVVDGDKFLKVQSPLFRGTASATLRLEGTLKEPLALGEVRINSGSVLFPFGTLDVKQGFVSLTSDNPFHPQLFVNAESERLGYEVKMEATGPADQPILQFTSTPPLTSEEILLMLTTGQSPQGVASSSTRQRAQGLVVFAGKSFLSDLGIGGGESRLTIKSGEQLTESGQPTYDIEYKLNDNWSLLGGYDRFSQYNFDIKWRVYSK